MEDNHFFYNFEANRTPPSRGKILISKPFLQDSNFARSVVLIVDHSEEGSMGLIMNKPSSLKLNELVKEFKHLDSIPLHKGGPMGNDTLFYLHNLDNITGSLAIGEGLYLNGNFNAIKKYILEGNPIEGHIRFFLGYSGWENKQLKKEIHENTWLINEGDITNLIKIDVKEMWKNELSKLGGKYEQWSHFPLIPSLN